MGQKCTKSTSHVGVYIYIYIIYAWQIFGIVPYTQTAPFKFGVFVKCLKFVPMVFIVS